MAEKMEDLMNLNNQKKDAVDNDIEKMIKKAEEYLGTPYVYGGESKKGIDCSSLIQKAYKAVGKEMPRVAMDQAKKGEKVSSTYDPSKLKRGDLIFFKDTSKKRKKGEVSHVGIYLGNGEMLHASSSKGVVKTKITDYYKNHFHSATRVLVNEKNKDNTTKNKPTISKSPSTSENTLTGAGNQAVKSDAERLEKFYKYIFDVEGGYSNHKNDNGGATKYGIIEKEARKHGYTGDMRDFPKEMAKDIYKKDYYLKNRLNEVKDDRVALSVFDWAVNGGSSRAVKEVQKVLNEMNGNNDLSVDGIIGKYTLAALNGADPEKLLKAYQQAQSNFYDGIVKRNPSQKVFLKGWQNRLAKRENFIKTELAPSTRKNLSEVKNEFSSQAKTETNQKKMGNNIQKQR